MLERLREPRVRRGIAFALVLLGARVLAVFYEQHRRHEIAEKLVREAELKANPPAGMPYADDAGFIATKQVDGSIKKQTPAEALEEVERFVRQHGGSVPQSTAH